MAAGKRRVADDKERRRAAFADAAGAIIAGRWSEERELRSFEHITGHERFVAESAALRDEDDHYAALIGEVEACAKIAFEIMGLTNVPEDVSRLRGASRISASRRRGRTFFG